MKRTAINTLVEGLCFCLMILTTGCLQKDNGSSSSGSNGSLGNNPGFHVQPDPITPPITPELPAPVPTDPGFGSTVEGIIINNGDAYTTSAVLNIAVYKFEALFMKFSLNDNCAGGDWITYSQLSALDAGAANLNKKVNVSVQFKDYDLTVSNCFNASIIHDNIGPEILFHQYPVTSLDEGVPTDLIYEVTDASVGVQSVQCRLNDVVSPCSAGRTIIQVPGAGEGNYVFEVTATDLLGNVSHDSVSWQVSATTREITHDISVAEYRKWDILFIIDNSGSMEFEQKSMASRTRNFLSVLHGLDWQIAITTTDPRSAAVGGDGRFLELSGHSGEYLLNSSMNENDAQLTLSNTLQRPETGSGSEQAIRSTYRSIERSLIPTEVNHKNFFRSGANFSVVLISDEDESANTTKNDPQSLLNLVLSTFGGQKNFLFNSIITVPQDTACLSTYGYSYGERYKSLTQLTGGVMGSVCESDYTAQVNSIADKITGMAKSFTLSCAPVASMGVEIVKDGVSLGVSYSVDGVKLNFATAIEPGNYQLKYHCLK
ncbi:MAG: hypothetical protein ABL927_00540 [Bdellovibrionales bacterium]